MSKSTFISAALHTAILLWVLVAFPAAKIDDPPDAFTMGVLYLENLLAEGWKLRLGALKR